MVIRNHAVLKTTHCPECDFPSAEVKRSNKSGLLYRWCPECNAQFFARTPEASARLAKRIGLDESKKAAEPAPGKPAAEPVPPKAAVDPIPPKAAKPAAGSVFDQLFGGKA